MFKRLIVLFCIAVSVLGFRTAVTGEPQAPRNIILFIGDGMGVAHITAAKIVSGTLNLERFTVVGLLTTHAHDDLITDSAASSTAMATGVKTYNGAISVSPDGKPLKTVLEYAEELGMSTGLVVTCSVTHATPAAFAAHIDNRQKENEIAEQIVASGVDVLFGGGWAHFVPQGTTGSRRRDDTDLLTRLAAEMKIARSPEEFRDLGDVPRAAALLARRHPPVAAKREISLAELTEKAIRILSKNENGFFLLVEGSQIDWVGHDHDSDEIIAEMIDFDGAIEKGLDFAENDGTTLVIVTSDHETGGYAVHGGSMSNGEVTVNGFTTGGHTAAMVPVFAYGPGAGTFGGIHDNTYIGATMIACIRR
ncbi:MAG: alkaline phosphatase [bacterium]|nr:MAG: alkaline phosphatase [bacterium]